jgi:hypothetical protein
MRRAEPAPGRPSGFGRFRHLLPGDPKSTATGTTALPAADVPAANINKPANEPITPTPPLASPLWRRWGKRPISRQGLLVLVPACLALLLSVAIAQMFHQAVIPPVRTGQIQIEELAPQRHAELGIEPVEPDQPAKPRLSARTHAVPSSRHNPGPSTHLPCHRRSC